MKRSVCVIGAGVSGLTTAIHLTRLGHDVKIYSRESGNNTTSSAAAAFWYPFWTGQKPDHSWYRPEWATETFFSLLSLIDIEEAGLCLTPILEFFDAELPSQEVKEVIDSMWWQVLPGIEFKTFPPLSRPVPFQVDELKKNLYIGLGFKTIVANMRLYLPFLNNLLEVEGIRVEEGVDFASTEDFPKDFDFIVNCTGLGSMDLFADDNLIYKEGVVLRVDYREDIDSILLIHTGNPFSDFPVYVVPRGGTAPDLILGGSIDPDPEAETDKMFPRRYTWGRIPRTEDRISGVADRILRWSCALEPLVRTCIPREVIVGYRPARAPSVRLEPSVEVLRNSRTKILHNYGHGGGGITLSWGCAKLISRWIEWLT